MLQIAVLDDENHALERFEKIAGGFKEIALCKLFGDADDLFAYIENNALDAVFLDIEMPEKSGMQLAEELCMVNPEITVVFVTAFSHYAVEAFERNVFDYIVKPVSEERLRKTLDRILRGRQLANPRMEKQVSIQCFRRFECKVDEKVLQLNHLMKAKELLAFLVSRKGASTSWQQITEALWPEADYEKAHNNLYVTTYRLRKWLAENGLAHIFECKRNGYRILPSEFSCDFYELEKAEKNGNKEKAKQLYQGDFLEEDGYEWAYPIQAEWSMKISDLIEVRFR